MCNTVTAVVAGSSTRYRWRTHNQHCLMLCLKSAISATGHNLLALVEQRNDLVATGQRTSNRMI